MSPVPVLNPPIQSEDWHESLKQPNNVNVSALTVALCHRLNDLAPLPRHFGESPHPELVERAAVECRHSFGGLVSVVCVDPGVRRPLANRLVLYDVFDDASIGIFRGLPPHLDG